LRCATADPFEARALGARGECDMTIKLVVGPFLFCSLCSLVACSGSTSWVDGSGDHDAATGDDGGASGDAAASGDAGAAVDGATHVDGGGDATGSDGGDDRIDPIVVGRTWTYDVTEMGNYPLCPSGSHDASVLGQSTKDGKLAFEVTSFCANAGSFFYSVSGDNVDWDYQGLWVIALDSPVQEGHTWTNTVETYAWHDAASVTVPVGTFSQCWRAQDTAGASYTTFCRGVGPVKWHVTDGLGNGYDAVLTAKNF
jgi:hypothetical protein